jgi:hypothetical protein
MSTLNRFQRIQINGQRLCTIAFIVLCGLGTSEAANRRIKLPVYGISSGGSIKIYPTLEYNKGVSFKKGVFLNSGGYPSRGKLTFKNSKVKFRGTGGPRLNALIVKGRSKLDVGIDRTADSWIDHLVISAGAQLEVTGNGSTSINEIQSLGKLILTGTHWNIGYGTIESLEVRGNSNSTWIRAVTVKTLVSTASELSLSETNINSLTVTGTLRVSQNSPFEAVTLSIGEATLEPFFNVPNQLDEGKSFVLINRPGTAPFAERFKNVPDGIEITHSRQNLPEAPVVFKMKYSYSGGTGNDLVATLVEVVSPSRP